jgi:hypothetical protein
VGGNQYNSRGQKHIAGSNNNYRRPVNNGDRFHGPVRAGAVGGSGHINSFTDPSASNSQLLNADDDELLNVNIALIRAKHEKKQLAIAVANTETELASVLAELSAFKK